MHAEEPDFTIAKLGTGSVPSPLKEVTFIPDEARVLFDSDPAVVGQYFRAGKEPPSAEMAGPREKIFFDPKELRCGIVTCGGLCPGLNDVVRAIVMCLYYQYGVRAIYGFRYGYEGLVEKYGHIPLELLPKGISRINEMGGTVLGTSRGNQDVPAMADTLEKMKISILFALGGDGTLRGAQALCGELRRRGLKISVIGIPKTIDNDISFVQKTFGFETAVGEARRFTYAAHTEAVGARNGIGLVKLMGRDSGFIAAYAALADNQVNFCLIPEVPFTLEGFLKALEQRLIASGHAAIVVAEGAGQDLMKANSQNRDASGNTVHEDIGIFLRDKIRAYFRKTGMEINLKYIDPGYSIRSMPANAYDAAFCSLLGHDAVHAGISGRTDMIVGGWKGETVHIPIALAVSARKKIDPKNWFWEAVLAATGQPRTI